MEYLIFYLVGVVSTMVVIMIGNYWIKKYDINKERVTFAEAIWVSVLSWIATILWFLLVWKLISDCLDERGFKWEHYRIYKFLNKIFTFGG